MTLPTGSPPARVTPVRDQGRSDRQPFSTAPAPPAPATSPVRPPCLVALDIDGTLLRTGQPPSADTVAAVRDVIDGGDHVVLATGRSFAGVLPVVKRLGLRSGWVVCSNGAVTARITRRHGLTVESAITFEPMQSLQRALTVFPGALLAVEHVGRGWKVNATFPHGRLSGKQRVVHERRLWRVPVTRAALYAQGIVDLVQELGWLDVTATPAGPDWVDVTAVGISKATALEKVRRALGVAQDSTWAVGDGANDVDMLRWAGVGVAMGHARHELKAVANRETGSITADGVVPVLRELVAR